MTDDANKSDDSKLFIDDDWKAQARKEKEELSQQYDNQPSGAEEPMAADLLTLVESLAMQAMMAMGVVPHPAAEGKRIFDGVQARYLVDTIVMLKEKTKGNQTKEEEDYLKRILPELQLTFVEMSKAVAAAAAKPGVAPMGGVQSPEKR